MKRSYIRRDRISWDTTTGDPPAAIEMAPMLIRLGSLFHAVAPEPFDQQLVAFTMGFSATAMAWFAIVVSFAASLPT